MCFVAIVGTVVGIVDRPVSRLLRLHSKAVCLEMESSNGHHCRLHNDYLFEFQPSHRMDAGAFYVGPPNGILSTKYVGFRPAPDWSVSIFWIRDRAARLFSGCDDVPLERGLSLAGGGTSVWSSGSDFVGHDNVYFVHDWTVHRSPVAGAHGS